MPSPFPGMDPYLESAGLWQDFHTRFLTYWCDAIAGLLPDIHDVRIEEYVQLVGPPVAVPLPSPELDEPVARYLKILNLPERSLVTVLELLSPANKREPGRSEYVARRNSLRRQGVHLVELDLLVKGQRLPMGGPLPPGHYYALVLRDDGRPTGDVYAWTVRQPLPRLPIPLREPDPDVWFDLGAVFATAYERGRYARLLTYDRPPELPLGDEDRAWVSEQARRRGA